MYKKITLRLLADLTDDSPLWKIIYSILIEMRP